MKFLVQFLVVIALAIGTSSAYPSNSWLTQVLRYQPSQSLRPLSASMKQEQPLMAQQPYARLSEQPMQFGSPMQQQPLQMQQPVQMMMPVHQPIGNRMPAPLRQQLENPCASNPCLNEGICSANANGFICTCPWGWRGARCEECLTECSSNPCPPNKICKARFGGGFDCVCPSNRAGENCEILNDLCANNPCLNGGMCNPIEGGSYRCVCAKPWTGNNCEQVWQNPCTEEVLRSSEVVQFLDPWDKRSYLICVDVGKFHSMPCSVGTYFHENLRHCVPEGYDPPSCPARYCHHDGECLVDEHNLLKCVCKKGFSGDRCEVNIDECLIEGNAACQGGVCVDQINGYYCRCPNGIGLNCRDTIQDPCTAQNMALDNHFFEMPTPGRNVFLTCTGEHQFVVSKCADNLFWHHEEKTCTIERPPLRSGLCMAAPCKNGGECQANGNGFSCLCKPGYTGVTCEQMIDFCLSNPCQNGGRCLSYAGGYTCVCADKVIDECCCNGIVNPCPPKSRLIPGVNNYFPHLFAHRYIHCDFDGRAFVRTCAPKTRWSQDVLSCLPDKFVLNQTEVLRSQQANMQFALRKPLRQQSMGYEMPSSPSNGYDVPVQPPVTQAPPASYDVQTQPPQYGYQPPVTQQPPASYDVQTQPPVTQPPPVVYEVPTQPPASYDIPTQPPVTQPPPEVPQYGYQPPATQPPSYDIPTQPPVTQPPPQVPQYNYQPPAPSYDVQTPAPVTQPPPQVPQYGYQPPATQPPSYDIPTQPPVTQPPPQVPQYNYQPPAPSYDVQTPAPVTQPPPQVPQYGYQQVTQPPPSFDVQTQAPSYGYQAPVTPAPPQPSYNQYQAPVRSQFNGFASQEGTMGRTMQVPQAPQLTMEQIKQLLKLGIQLPESLTRSLNGDVQKLSAQRKYFGYY